MSFVERLWNFTKRHKGKLLTGTVIVGGFLYLNHYAKRRLREWQDGETAECVERMRKEQHFKNTQVTCKTTVVGRMHSLQSRVMALADCKALTDRLQTLPSNRLDIWEELKCESFTRILAAVYGSSLLATALNVQLSILGGYMYRDAASLTVSSAGDSTGRGSCGPSASVKVQQRYLALAHHFLGPGCESMVCGLRVAAENNIGGLSLKEGLTLEKLQDLINNTRHEFEKAIVEGHVDTGNGNDLQLMSFLLPEEGNDDSSAGQSPDDSTLLQLMRETRDLFESSECKAVLKVTLEAAFQYMMDQAAVLFIPRSAVLEEVSANHQPSASANGFVNPNKVTLQLAKLIPFMSQLSLSLLGDRAEQLTTRLLLLDEQKVLGANVYEAFSQSQN